MGAEEALRAAAGGIPLRAVIADGAGASTLGDQQIVAHGLSPVFVSEVWLTMHAIELVSGENEPPPLKTIVGHIRVPVLLIASNAPSERAIDNVYRQRIGPNAALWYLPDIGHISGLPHTRRLTPRGSARFSKRRSPTGNEGHGRRERARRIDWRLCQWRGPTPSGPLGRPLL
jgi:hypothetical protein